MQQTDITRHRVEFADSRRLGTIEDDSIDLVVTSPPYPMIEMWDELFASLNCEIGESLHHCDGPHAFELMNRELDKTWIELARVVKEHGFVCINIGDATRKIGAHFQLYSNHSRITTKCTELGFQPLPIALWKKSTNAPNKFMGSGMLPAGAYITLEHEYLLVFRKGGKREFKLPADKRRRNRSAIFWEERNKWFSDSWDLKGVRQAMKHDNMRNRNAAYPFELPYRLINMYSVKGDTIFDPFLGTGTSTFAAIASERNSIGIEYDKNFLEIIMDGLHALGESANCRITQRLEDHIAFCKNYQANKGPLKYKNECFGFPVMTRQETMLDMKHIAKIVSGDPANIIVEYAPLTCVFPSSIDFSCEQRVQHADHEQISLQI
ncbi:MAG: site-specific DNA-methyltransferase [Chitinivibrionales bacterium]|nr:site-specific DNA-methyltransferase [Chitinivibrionales bacterium]